jgi:hypothetical protein
MLKVVRVGSGQGLGCDLSKEAEQYQDFYRFKGVS